MLHRFRLSTAALALLFTLPFSFPLHAQQYGIEIETVSEDIGLLVGALGATDLTGYSTTRIYATTVNSTDFVSSVSGDAVNPTMLSTTTDFYHSLFGGGVPNGINSLLFPVYPDLAYDSWVTIGLEGSPNAVMGEANVSTVQSAGNPWLTTFEPGGGLPGGNIAIDDPIGGAWFALNGDANGVAGDDLKVLVGQFTTTGELSGQLYIQFFIEGDGANEFRDTFFIGGPPAVEGCIDETACNFDPEANTDDGSCSYADAGLDCDGNCLEDVDGDGICDGDEIPGCTDGTACNYAADATDDDGSCSYADAGLDCDGNCIEDADGDGICDGDEIPGCTDDTACNYADDATDDDGSCSYADAGLDCDGNCLEDADGDGICDGDEIPGCTDDTANNYNPAATDDDGSCSYGCSPDWGEPTTYPSVATVLALITVEGDNAGMDDAVGAFVGDELRGTGDIISFNGATYINMSVYLSGGEELVEFVFFNQAECSTCSIDAGLTVMSFGEYGSFDDPLMFDANCSATSLEVDALEGWNYVSTNVMPEDYAISTLFEEALGGSLLKVLGDDNFALGGSYTPGIPSVFNSLQMHSDAAGYVMKLNADALWSSTGEPLDPASTPLDLNEGWNIIGYVPQASMPVEEALASIDGVVGTVIDGQNGTAWNPSNPNEFNSLLDMEPGRSYWVQMIEAATLTYPTASEDDPGMAIASLRTGDNAAETMTGWTVVRAPFAAAVVADVRLDDSPVMGEAYIGAFVNETCVAARPVVQFNGMTGAQLAILLEEEAEVSFRLWVDGQEFVSSDVLNLLGGEELGQAGEVMPIIRFGSTANAVVESDWASHISLSPVPAQNVAWMDLNVHLEGQARIVVLDARGAEVAVLHQGQLAAGQHRLAVQVSSWAAGTYFVKGTGPNGLFRIPLMVH